jgi:hypothetical protein
MRTVGSTGERVFELDWTTCGRPPGKKDPAHNNLAQAIVNHLVH